MGASWIGCYYYKGEATEHFACLYFLGVLVQRSGRTETNVLGTVLG